MTKLRLLLAGGVAMLTMAFGVSNASAVTVFNPGSYTATFAAGGLTLSTAGGSVNCPSTARITINADGSATVTNVVRNPNPCNGWTFTWLTPYTASLTSGALTINSVGVGISAAGGAISCLFSGAVVIPVTSGSTTAGAPSGSLNGGSCPLGNASIGGTGGTLSRAPIFRA